MNGWVFETSFVVVSNGYWTGGVGGPDRVALSLGDVRTTVVVVVVAENSERYLGPCETYNVRYAICEPWT